VIDKYFDRAAAEWDQQEYRLNRLKVIARAMEREIPLIKTMKGLDFGCGTGLLGFSLIDKIAYMTFVDTSEGMIEQVRLKAERDYAGRAGWQVRDIVAEGLEGCFDLIVSNMALHHIPDVTAALTILSRALNRGGYMGLCDLEREDGTFHGEGADIPHPGFDVDGMESLLSSLGLEKVSTTTPFVNRKVVEGEEREYPLFLTVFRKN